MVSLSSDERRKGPLTAFLYVPNAYLCIRIQQWWSEYDWNLKGPNIPPHLPTLPSKQAKSHSASLILSQREEGTFPFIINTTFQTVFRTCTGSRRAQLLEGDPRDAMIKNISTVTSEMIRSLARRRVCVSLFPYTKDVWFSETFYDGSPIYPY